MLRNGGLIKRIIEEDKGAGCSDDTIDINIFNDCFQDDLDLVTTDTEDMFKNIRPEKSQRKL